MKTSKLYTLLLLPLAIFLFIISSSTICPSQTEKPRMNVGYTTTSLPDVDIKDATAALNIWIKELGDKEGFQTKSVLYEDADSLIRDFANKKLDMAFLKTLDYLAALKKINAEPGILKTREGKGTLKYLLLASSNPQYTNIRDLKNLRLAILKNNDLGMMFLNTQLLKAKLPEAEKFFGVIQQKAKESQVLLSVFFGQADICILTDASFKTMTELNPQIGQKIKIVTASPELIETVSFMQKDLDQRSREKIIRASERLKESERGRQMLLLFNGDGIEKLTDDKLETTKQLLIEYERLKGKK